MFQHNMPETHIDPPKGRDGFEIAIICALKRERNAVEELMEVDFGDNGYKSGKAIGDRNSYTTGILGGQVVVLAYPRDMGTLNAATVASDLRLSFQKIKLALVVGVAGGAPQTPDGSMIRLGDVIVSSLVVQYDFGRQYPDTFKRKTEPESTFGRTNTEIASFLAKVAGGRSNKRVTEGTRQHIRVSRPTAVDRLYSAQYRHKHRSSHVCDLCNNCKEWYDPICEEAEKSSCEELGCAQEASGQDSQLQCRLLEAAPVQLHFGRVASGNAVIKSGTHRDKLVSKERVIGFEMEGAGTWDHLPTIIVKSVCDYADSHKNKEWQDYAAAVAAACVKSMLREWESTDLPDNVTYPQPGSGTQEMLHRGTEINPSLHSQQDSNYEDLEQPSSLVLEAAEDFLHDVNVRSQPNFVTMSFTDVQTKIMEVERLLATRGENRSLRRLRPLMTSLKHFAQALQPLCRTEQHFDLIWTPIALCLQISHRDATVLETLVTSYARMATALPGPNEFSFLAHDKLVLYRLIATVYEDLLEHHKNTLVMLASSDHLQLFPSLWHRSRFRWRCLLTTLDKLKHVVHESDPSRYLVNVLEQRTVDRLNLDDEEKREAETELKSLLIWLDIGTYRQAELLEELCSQHCDGTSDWLFQNPVVSSWLSNTNQDSILSIVGKPGSGKSVLCAQLVQLLQQRKDSSVAFYLCSVRTSSQHGIEEILRFLIANLLEGDRDCATYVYYEFVLNEQKPNASVLKKLLPTLLSVSGKARIIIDGLDECSHKAQQDLLKVLLSLAKAKTPGYCKTLIFSRNISSVQRMVQKHPILYLDRQSSLKSSIGIYVKHKLDAMWEDLSALDESEELVQKLESDIVAKADGMFLWVKLVFAGFLGKYSIGRLQAVIDGLPRGIEEIYGQILQRIRTACDDDNKISDIQRLFSMLLVAERPLKVHELVDAITFCDSAAMTEEDRKSRLLLDLCKPLIEVSSSDIVSMVHFTARLYLTHNLSGPFLTWQHALGNATLACMTYVNFSLTLVNDDALETRPIESVVRSFHSFHDFACAHWLGYLSKYEEHVRDAEQYQHHDRLSTIAAEFCDRYLMLSKASIAHETTYISSDANFARLFNNPAGRQVMRMIKNAKSPQVHEAHALQESQSRDIVVDRSVSDSTTNLQDEASPAKDELLARVSEKYKTLVNQLLNDDSEQRYPDLSLYLPTFRKRHCYSRFACRRSDCVRNADGFDTSEARDEHERAHSPRITCDHADCHIGTVFGFRTRAQLRLHNRTFHEASTTNLMRIRRRKQQEAVQFSQSQPQQQAPGQLVLEPQQPPTLFTPRAILEEYPALVERDWSSHYARTRYEDSQNQSQQQVQVQNDLTPSQPPAFSFPQALLEQYPALASIDWSDQQARTQDGDSRNQSQQQAQVLNNSATQQLPSLPQVPPRQDDALVDAAWVEYQSAYQASVRGEGSQGQSQQQAQVRGDPLPEAQQSTSFLPQALLAQYPALADIDWSDHQASVQDGNYSNLSSLGVRSGHVDLGSTFDGSMPPEDKHVPEGLNFDGLTQEQAQAKQRLFVIYQRILAKVVNEISHEYTPNYHGWQATPKERGGWVLHLVNNLRSLEGNISRCMTLARQFEKMTINNAQHKAQYEQNIRAKLEEIKERRRQLDNRPAFPPNMMRAPSASDVATASNIRDTAWPSFMGQYQYSNSPSAEPAHSTQAPAMLSTIGGVHIPSVAQEHSQYLRLQQQDYQTNVPPMSKSESQGDDDRGPFSMPMAGFMVNHSSPMLNSTDPSYTDSYGIDSFALNDQPTSNFHSPAHSPQPPPSLVAQQQLPVFTSENNFGLDSTAVQVGSVDVSAAQTYADVATSVPNASDVHWRPPADAVEDGWYGPT